MFLQLWAVQACTVSTVMGQGLALRGPDGSMDKAVRHMARQSRATYAMFSLGIMLIKASTLIFIVNSFSVFVSVPAALLCSIIAFRSYTSEQALVVVVVVVVVVAAAAAAAAAAVVVLRGLYRGEASE